MPLITGRKQVAPHSADRHTSPYPTMRPAKNLMASEPAPNRLLFHLCSNIRIIPRHSKSHQNSHPTETKTATSQGGFYNLRIFCEVLAPEVGLEPTTLRLTGGSSALEHLCYQRSRARTIWSPFGTQFGVVFAEVFRRDKHSTLAEALSHNRFWIPVVDRIDS